MRWRSRRCGGPHGRDVREMEAEVLKKNRRGREGLNSRGTCGVTVCSSDWSLYTVRRIRKCRFWIRT